MNISQKKRKAALRAGKKHLSAAMHRSRSIRSLTWWERLAWTALAGTAGALSSLLAGCGQCCGWSELTPDQQQAWRAADRAFHRWSGEPIATACTAKEGK